MNDILTSLTSLDNQISQYLQEVHSDEEYREFIHYIHSKQQEIVNQNNIQKDSFNQNANETHALIQQQESVFLIHFVQLTKIKIIHSQTSTLESLLKESYLISNFIDVLRVK